MSKNEGFNTPSGKIDFSTSMNDYTSYGNSHGSKINGVTPGIVKVPKPPESKIPTKELPFNPNRL